MFYFTYSLHLDHTNPSTCACSSAYASVCCGLYSSSCLASCVQCSTTSTHPPVPAAVHMPVSAVGYIAAAASPPVCNGQPHPPTHLCLQQCVCQLWVMQQQLPCILRTMLNHTNPPTCACSSAYVSTCCGLYSSSSCLASCVQCSTTPTHPPVPAAVHMPAVGCAAAAASPPVGCAG